MLWARTSWRCARGADIGIVFQSFHLVPTMTALENIAYRWNLPASPMRNPLRAITSTRWGLARAPTISRRSFRAASSSAWRWPRARAETQNHSRWEASRQSRRQDRTPGCASSVAADWPASTWMRGRARRRRSAPLRLRLPPAPRRARRPRRLDALRQCSPRIDRPPMPGRRRPPSPGPRAAWSIFASSGAISRRFPARLDERADRGDLDAADPRLFSSRFRTPGQPSASSIGPAPSTCAAVAAVEGDDDRLGRQLGASRPRVEDGLHRDGTVAGLAERTYICSANTRLGTQRPDSARRRASAITWYMRIGTRARRAAAPEIVGPAASASSGPLAIWSAPRPGPRRRPGACRRSRRRSPPGRRPRLGRISSSAAPHGAPALELCDRVGRARCSP